MIKLDLSLIKINNFNEYIHLKIKKNKIDFVTFKINFGHENKKTITKIAGN